jgi:predicted Fe-Mo cluster-binding NifX family protein
MRIAISLDGDNINSNVDQRFGRCKYFMVVDIENKKIIKSEIVLNKGAEQGHGAGIKAAEQVADFNVNYVLTGELGPNSSSVLDKLNINSYHASGKVKDAINMFLEDKLEKITKIAKPHGNKEKKENNDVQKNDNPERVFIPLLNDNGLDSDVSEHFGHAPFFAVYNTKTKNLEIKENKLDHVDQNKSPVDQIVELADPTTVFALGIGARAIQLFNEKGITIKTGECSTVKDVIDNIKDLDTHTHDCGHKH